MIKTKAKTWGRRTKLPMRHDNDSYPDGLYISLSSDGTFFWLLERQFAESFHFNHLQSSRALGLNQRVDQRVDAHSRSTPQKARVCWADWVGCGLSEGRRLARVGSVGWATSDFPAIVGCRWDLCLRPSVIYTCFISRLYSRALHQRAKALQLLADEISYPHSLHTENPRSITADS